MSTPPEKPNPTSAFSPRSCCTTQTPLSTPFRLSGGATLADGLMGVGF